MDTRLREHIPQRASARKKVQRARANAYYSPISQRARENQECAHTCREKTGSDQHTANDRGRGTNASRGRVKLDPWRKIEPVQRARVIRNSGRFCRAEKKLVRREGSPSQTGACGLTL